MLGVILIILSVPALFLTIDFIRYIYTGKRLFNKSLLVAIELMSIVLLPLIFLDALDKEINHCCLDTAAFSPEHKLTIYVWISICVLVYFYSSWRNTITTPILEVLINSILLFGLVFNLLLLIHIYEDHGFIAIIGNLPIAILFIYQLSTNHKNIIESLKNNTITSNNFIGKIALKILHQNIFIKIPFLLILCLPIIFIVCSFLLLFGQKPDSLIRAFTETYKHGFSQWDYMCDNVQCGGHFLCSVAANGHSNIVKPVRYGERNGNKIICNRQLLIANAFEELIEHKFPRAHQIIRHNYNKIGNTIHKHYHIFNNKFIADSIYFLMKPLELFFLLILYTFDKKPENRIAMQYLNKSEKKALEEI